MKSLFGAFRIFHTKNKTVLAYMDFLHLSVSLSMPCYMFFRLCAIVSFCRLRASVYSHVCQSGISRGSNLKKKRNFCSFTSFAHLLTIRQVPPELCVFIRRGHPSGMAGEKTGITGTKKRKNMAALPQNIDFYITDPRFP